MRLKFYQKNDKNGIIIQIKIKQRLFMINVLMIEDDTEFAEILSEYLAKYNIKITNYEDPYLGLSAGIKNYDLLILDLTLPGIDGLEVCKEVVQKYDIPIIISSARSDVSDKVIGLQIGADDYLPKPYDPKEMYEKVLEIRANTMQKMFNVLTREQLKMFKDRIKSHKHIKRH